MEIDRDVSRVTTQARLASRYRGFLRAYVPEIIQMHRGGANLREIAALVNSHRRAQNPSANRASDSIIYYILVREGVLPASKSKSYVMPRRLAELRAAGLSENDKLALSIDDLGLSVRARNSLFHDGIRTVGQLVRHTGNELMRAPNFGRVSLTEVELALEALGLCLEDRLPLLPPEPPPPSALLSAARSYCAILDEYGLAIITGQEPPRQQLVEALAALRQAVRAYGPPSGG